MTSKDEKKESTIQLIILGEGDEIAPTPEEAAWDREMDILWSRNLYLGLLHMFNFVAGFWLSKTVSNMKNFRIPLSTIFLDWDANNNTAS